MGRKAFAECLQLGGLTLTQSSEEAGQAAMPEYALDSGAVHGVDGATQLAETLSLWATGRAPLPDVLFCRSRSNGGRSGTDWRVRTSALSVSNFNDYEQSVLLPRLLRFARLHGCDGIEGLTQRLRRQECSLAELVGFSLESRGTFFRDSLAFAGLERTLQQFFDTSTELSELGPALELRGWVVGCGTGEEAYSVAMSVLSLLPETAWPSVKIFATDVDEQALEVARRGRYSPEQLMRVPTRFSGAVRTGT